MTIQGQEITRVTLSPNTETTIEYSKLQQGADVLVTGGEVYLTWRGKATVGSQNCLKLPAGMGFEMRPKRLWNQLSLISAAAAEVQVVVQNGIF